MRLFVSISIFLLSFSSYSNECRNSSYWEGQYVEEINEELCLSLTKAFGAEHFLLIESKRGIRYQGFDRVRAEFFDWDGDERFDLIRLTKYLKNPDTHLLERFKYGAEEVSFYKGDAHRVHLIDVYGSLNECLNSLQIQENEVGLFKFSGFCPEIEFTHIHEENPRSLFKGSDLLLKSILTERNLDKRFFRRLVRGYFFGALFK